MKTSASDGRSREWVLRLPAVVKALNSEETRLTSMKPQDAIKMKSIQSVMSQDSGHAVGLQENTFLAVLL